jgi:hypothetical protein
MVSSRDAAFSLAIDGRIVDNASVVNAIIKRQDRSP